MKIIIGKYEGTIYVEGNGYTGAIQLGTDAKGNRTRLKRKGRTKEIVKDKLKQAVAELEAGIETANDYTVENAVRDWLTRGTKGPVCQDDQRLQEPRRVQPHPVHRRPQAQRTNRRRRRRLARSPS
jgi:hypothetical protein